ncbi:MAG: class B sortase [Oscillospiraceae bacterium]
MIKNGQIKKQIKMAFIAALICISAWVLVGSAEKKVKPTQPEIQPTPTAQVQEETEQNPIDFELLQGENPDIYAWITIPDMEIDFPVLQHPADDSYYLTHTELLEKKVRGAIYTERENGKDFTQRNTVIYGHNMDNPKGGMFTALRNYRQADFFDSHRDITIYTPNEILHYKVFAAYETDNRHILFYNDFTTDEGMGKYLAGVYAAAEKDGNVAKDVLVGATDKIITLSTCKSVKESDRRYLVQAVLIE